MFNCSFLIIQILICRFYYRGEAKEENRGSNYAKSIFPRAVFNITEKAEYSCYQGKPRNDFDSGRNYE